MKPSVRACVGARVWLLAACAASACAAVCVNESSSLGSAQCTAWDASWVALGGANWLACNGMRHNPCGCSRVTCSPGEGITRLNLDNMNLRGSAPPQWGALTNLGEILVAENPGLGGPLPPEWAALKQLTRLRGRGCALNGTLPVWLADLPRLFSVELARNEFSGALPPEWGAAPSPAISDLRLQGNRLNGTLPPEWARLTRLLLFYGFENELSGSLPPAWGSLPALHTVNLGRNRLNGSLPGEWGDAQSKLATVGLERNEIGGELPASWGSLPRLSELHLNDNRLEGTVPLSWAGPNMSSAAAGGRFEYFMLQNNRLRGTMPDVRVPTTNDNGPCDVRGNFFACPLPAAAARYCAGPGGVAAAHSAVGAGLRVCCDPGFRFEGLPPAPRQCRPCAPGAVSGAQSALACSLCPAGKWQNGPNCTDCAAGRHAPLPGAADCADCPYGQQQLSLGATSCDECATGQFYSSATPSAASSASAASARRCFDCAPGRVANLAATAPCASNSSGGGGRTCEAAVRCALCAAGRFQPAAGGFNATGAASCGACVAGTFSNTSGSSACEPCPIGRWSSAGQASCGGCSVGFEVSLAATGCDACAAGRFSILGGRCTRFTVCEPGSHVTQDPSAVRDRACATCEPGRVSALSNAPECTQCAAGQYADRSGSVACSQCGLGQFQNASGQGSCVACATLFGGTRTSTVSTGSARANDCVRAGAAGAVALCGDGQQAVDAVKGSRQVCEPCPAGRFKTGTNSKPCELCECGAFSGPGASSCGVFCVAGTYGNTVTSTCDPCPQGSFCVDGRARPNASATRCSPGSFVSRALTPAADRECALCPAGRVSRDSNAETCTECAAGRFQLLPGQAFCETAPPCKPGEYAANRSAASRSERCAPCPVGSWCVDETRRACDIAGYHCDEPGLSFPKSCSEGFVCAGAGSSEPVQARRCPVGSQCTATTIEQCPPGTISTNGTGKCVSCEDGHFAHRGYNRCERCPVAGGRVFKCAPGEEPRLADPNVFCARCRDDEGSGGGGGGGGTALASLGTADFLPCRVRGACNTTVDTSTFVVRTRCAADADTGRITRKGALCGACADGFGAAGPSCTACPPQGTVEGVLGPAALVFVALFTQCVRTALRQSHSQSKGKHLTMTSLKILVSFLYTTSLLSAYQLDWGENLRWLFGISSAVATGDASAVALTSCIGIDLHAKMKLVSAAPLVAMLLPLPILGYMRLSGQRELERAGARTVYRAGVLIAWWLMHPAVVRECLLVLLTTRVGDKTYVAADLSVSVEDDQYAQTKGLAIVVLSTFAMGLPLLVFGALYRYRAHLSTAQAQRGAPKDVRQHLFYFYGSFHPKFYYWEVAQFTLKTVMVVIAAQASVTPQPGACLFAATWVMLFAYMLEYRENAYRRAIEGRLMQATLFGLLGLLLAAQGLAMGENEQNDNLKNGARALAAATTLSIVVVFLGVTTAHCARTSGHKLRSLASRRDISFSSFRIAGSSRDGGGGGGGGSGDRAAWKAAAVRSHASSVEEAAPGSLPEWAGERDSEAARVSGGWSSAAAPTQSVSFDQVNPMQVQRSAGGAASASAAAGGGNGSGAGTGVARSSGIDGGAADADVDTGALSAAAVGQGGARPIARSIV